MYFNRAGQLTFMHTKSKGFSTYFEIILANLVYYRQIGKFCKLQI